VSIQRGKILASGDDSEMERMRGMSTKVINAGGKRGLPGLVDGRILRGLHRSTGRQTSRRQRF
jgi:hypothetical protein